MRYEFVPGESSVAVRAHAPLHDVAAETHAVEGWFEADPTRGVPEGAVAGAAEVRLDSFDADNALVKLNTLRWLKARKHPVARFELETVEAAESGHRISGRLAISGNSGLASVVATVELDAEHGVVSGSWGFVQSHFGLKAPRLAMLKVDDEIDVDFRLVARRTES